MLSRLFIKLFLFLFNDIEKLRSCSVTLVMSCSGDIPTPNKIGCIALLISMAVRICSN